MIENAPPPKGLVRDDVIVHVISNKTLAPRGPCDGVLPAWLCFPRARRGKTWRPHRACLRVGCYRCVAQVLTFKSSFLPVKKKIICSTGGPRTNVINYQSGAAAVLYCSTTQTPASPHSVLKQKCILYMSPPLFAPVLHTHILIRAVQSTHASYQSARAPDFLLDNTLSRPDAGKKRKQKQAVRYLYLHITNCNT